MVFAVGAAVPAHPANLHTVPWRRNPDSAISGIKSTSYAENLLAFMAARAAGADEALILNTRGELCEGATSNLWHVTAGKLCTPGLHSGCLPGVTRQIVLELCGEAGVEVDQSARGGAALGSADAIFLTSSIRGLHPVGTCDGRVLDSALHPLVGELARALEEGRAAQRWK
jgi:branched-subunit amino acid aminotransferase/4-amino-4-deoxychorismate lyase